MEWVSKPHSKAVNSSRNKLDFSDNREPANFNNNTREREINAEANTKNIN